MKKNNLRDCHGILLLDKPLYLTSNQTLQRVKRLFNARKAGHTGSLDPLATGILPICFGKATKLAANLLAKDKYYRTTAKLGIKTNTGDAEGQIIAEKAIENITLEQIANVLSQFRGNIQQIPSMYSALKYQGEPLYKLARRGEEVPRAPRDITIYQLDLISYDAQTGLLDLDIFCSKGTYIRNLVDDIGDALGCGGSIIKLRRTAIAGFTDHKIYTPEELNLIFKEQNFSGLDSCLIEL